MEKIARAYDQDWKTDVTVRFSSGFLLEESSVDALIAEINFHQMDVLMLDPWQRIVQGADESSSSETAAMWDEIFRIRKETGCTILIIHHMRKDAELTPDAIRGSSRFRGEVDASILLRYDSDTTTLYVVVEGRDIPHSANDGAHPVKVIWEEEYQEVFALDGAEFEETVSITLKKGAVSDVNKQKILAAMQANGDFMTKTQLETETGFSKDTVSRHLKTLTEEAVVTLDPDTTGPGKTQRFKAV
jgi:DNA-binding transcriptional ArsR family regulator